MTGENISTGSKTCPTAVTIIIIIIIIIIIVVVIIIIIIITKRYICPRSQPKSMLRKQIYSSASS